MPEVGRLRRLARTTFEKAPRPRTRITSYRPCRTCPASASCEGIVAVDAETLGGLDGSSTGGGGEDVEEDGGEGVLVCRVAVPAFAGDAWRRCDDDDDGELLGAGAGIGADGSESSVGSRATGSLIQPDDCDSVGLAKGDSFTTI